MDSNFNHEAFFDNIVKLFEVDLNEEWIVETLDSWNI